MKRILCGIICICMLLSTFGCNKGNVEQGEVMKEFNIEKAIEVINKYMAASMKNDNNEMEKLYNKSLKKDNKLDNKQNVIINGYKFDEVNQAQDMADINVRVTKINTQTSYSSLETQDFKVKKEKGQYKISSIDITNESETFSALGRNNTSFNGKQIRVRFSSNVDTSLVTNLQGVPRYFYTQDDKARATKIPISNSEFGIIALTYEGTAEAITTRGDNPFIEVIHFNESMVTQGDSQDSSGSGSSSNDGGSSEGMESKPETPIGMEIVPMDVIPGATINNMVFSQDERYLAIQYSKANLGNSIKIYLNKNGKVISFKFENKYPMDKVDLKIINFVEDGLIYKVTPIKGKENDQSIKDIIGNWQIDMKKYKPKKIDEKEISNLKK
ncbi:hypothetical protein [Clostridium arbusti]|uniref:hypothetical protein n=1 Tax=Clostridium arbusti TaxID=1137848 RepID=UPI000289D13C|nr:hypothetical protein [Clostridium arbusti]